MKKIACILLMLLLLNSCGEGEKTTKLLYTKTEFNTLETASGSELNDHFNTKQAVGSSVYEVVFTDRTHIERRLITQSAEKIVYHDFCTVDDTVYAVGGEFGTHYDTAIIQQVYPIHRG